MDSQKLANLRAALYSASAIIGAIAVGYGILSQEQLALWLPLVPAVFALVIAVINVKSHHPVELEPHPEVAASLSRIEEKLDAVTPLNKGDHYDPSAAAALKSMGE